MKAQTNKSVTNPVTSLLTKREKDVLLLVMQGYTNKEIADGLYVTEVTVKTHISSIFRKLGVKNRTKATIVAKEKGLV